MVKFVKDEMIKSYENKYKAEAYNVMMIIAFIAYLEELFGLGILEGRVSPTFVPFWMFIFGGLYVAIRLSSKGLASYNPIKGVSAMRFYTISSAVISFIATSLLMLRHFSRDWYVDIPIYMLLLIFAIIFGCIFGISYVTTYILYKVSKKKEKEEDIE